MCTDPFRKNIQPGFDQIVRRGMDVGGEQKMQSLHAFCRGQRASGQAAIFDNGRLLSHLNPDVFKQSATRAPPYHRSAGKPKSLTERYLR